MGKTIVAGEGSCGVDRLSSFRVSVIRNLPPAMPAPPARNLKLDSKNLVEIAPLSNPFPHMPLRPLRKLGLRTLYTTNNPATFLGIKFAPQASYI